MHLPLDKRNFQTYICRKKKKNYKHSKSTHYDLRKTTALHLEKPMVR
jgi:hypothetical protein